MRHSTSILRYGSLLALACLPSLPALPANEDGEFPPIQEATKGCETVVGPDGKSFLRLYIDRKKHKLFAEIPGSRMGKNFLITASIAGGSFTGWQWNDMMVYWERLDRKLLLIEPEIRHRGGGKELSPVVKSTYRDRVVATVPIIGAGSGGTVLIDLKNLLAGQSHVFLGSLGGGVDLSITKVLKAKVFEKNDEIEFDLMRSGGRGFSVLGGSSGSGLAVHYSLSELPNTGYQPRKADDRIGYFLTAYKDFSRNEQDDTRFVRSINRWQLEKADPSLKLSNPKEPIVFYIEKTVPIRYRPYVKEGILEWNKAFEKIGILDAIVVRQQTETNEFADYDPEDVRYNFFRWITSESAFAMGPSRVHPETGQILDADIIFDDSMMRSFLEDYARMVEEPPTREFHPDIARYLQENPHRHPMRRWMRRQDLLRIENVPALEPAQPGAPEAEHPMCPPGAFALETPGDISAFSEDSHRACSLGNGMRHQFLFSLLALDALRGERAKEGGGKEDEWPEEFVGQVLKEVVMHEVGHTLGLRHNFKASSWLPLEKINSESPPDATTGSVMDYNPINIAPGGKPQGVWVTRTLGPYDYWAIEYGYTLDSGDANLQKIASRVAEDGLAYATDEDTWSSDPLVNRFDMGSDPLAYAGDRLAVIQRVMASLLDRAVRKGESYSKVRAAFDVLLSDVLRTCMYATRFVGGHYIHRDHKGDPNERPPIRPVEAERQRQALEFACEKVFAADALQFPPELVKYLASERWNHWGAYPGTPEYPLHDRILQVQLWTLWDFTNPRVLRLLEDSELRAPPDENVVTIPELLGRLTRAVWSECYEPHPGEYTNRKPFIDSVRRNLQHEYVAELVAIALEDDAGWSPQAARTQAAYQLEQLSGKIADVFASATVVLDDYCRAHLSRTQKRIEKALEATYTRTGFSNGGAGIILIGQPAGGAR